MPESGDIERSEVEAVIQTRRELGPDYESALVDSFAEKVEAAIAARVERPNADLEQRRLDRREAEARGHRQMVLGIVSLGTGIPITAIAGPGTDTGIAGMVVVWAGIAAVNVAHALQGRRRD